MAIKHTATRGSRRKRTEQIDIRSSSSDTTPEKSPHSKNVESSVSDSPDECAQKRRAIAKGKQPIRAPARSRRKQATPSSASTSEASEHNREVKYSKPIAAGYTVEFSKLKTIGCDIEHFFVPQGWPHILQIQEHIYEDLVHTFFSNMRVLRPKRLEIESEVGGVPIKLTPEILEHMLALPSTGNPETFKNKWVKNFPVTYEEAKEFLLTEPEPEPGLPAIKLSFEHRVLAYIIGTCLVPRVRSLESLSHRDTYFLYCLVQQIPIRLSFWIITVIIESSKAKDKHSSLPYGMLFTVIFRYCGVKLNQYSPTENKNKLDTSKFKLMKFECVDGKWIRNLSSHPRSTASPIPTEGPSVPRSRSAPSPVHIPAPDWLNDLKLTMGTLLNKMENMEQQLQTQGAEIAELKGLIQHPPVPVDIKQSLDEVEENIKLRMTSTHAETRSFIRQTISDIGEKLTPFLGPRRR